LTFVSPFWLLKIFLGFLAFWAYVWPFGPWFGIWVLVWPLGPLCGLFANLHFRPWFGLILAFWAFVSLFGLLFGLFGLCLAFWASGKRLFHQKTIGRKVLKLHLGQSIKLDRVKLADNDKDIGLHELKVIL